MGAGPESRPRERNRSRKFALSGPELVAGVQVQEWFLDQKARAERWAGPESRLAVHSKPDACIGAMAAKPRAAGSNPVLDFGPA